MAGGYFPITAQTPLKRRPSVPRMWPLESAVQAEGSFAFNRIADLAVRFASQACLGPPTALFVHAQKSGRRVPAVLLLYGVWKLGVNDPASIRMALWLRLVCSPPPLHRRSPIHSSFGCTKATSGMWAALAR